MRLNNLYYLDVHVEIPKNVALIGNVDENLIMWHKRLGHLGNSNLLKLGNFHMVSGIDIESKDLMGKTRMCESCIFGKHNRKPFFYFNT
jgi:hypothetical protein